jgi:hypothetical protein
MDIRGSGKDEFRNTHFAAFTIGVFVGANKFAPAKAAQRYEVAEYSSSTAVFRLIRYPHPSAIIRLCITEPAERTHETP